MKVGDFRDLVGYGNDEKELYIIAVNEAMTEKKAICGLYKSLSDDTIILISEK